MKNQRKPKKRNPQDATLRNIRALKKKVLQLQMDVHRCREMWASSGDKYGNLSARVGRLEELGFECENAISEHHWGKPEAAVKRALKALEKFKSTKK